MTPRARRIVRELLQTYAGVWYVAQNPTQQATAEKGAATMLEPKLREIEEAARNEAVCNPS